MGFCFNMEHKQTSLVTFYLIITPGSHYRCEPERLSFWNISVLHLFADINMDSIYYPLYEQRRYYYTWKKQSGNGPCWLHGDRLSAPERCPLSLQVSNRACETINRFGPNDTNGNLPVVAVFLQNKGKLRVYISKLNKSKQISNDFLCRPADPYNLVT